MRAKKNVRESESETDEGDEREEDVDRQKKEQTTVWFYSQPQTHVNKHTHTYSYNSYISLPQRNILLVSPGNKSSFRRNVVVLFFSLVTFTSVLHNHTSNAPLTRSVIRVVTMCTDI